MCQLLKEREDEREKRSEEQSRNVKERWWGETEVDGAKIRWRMGTGRADPVLSFWTKFPLKLLSNLAWGRRRTGVQIGKQGKGRGAGVPAAHQVLREDFPGPKGSQPCFPWDTPPSVKLASWVYGSAPCWTVSNQSLQVIPNYMLLVTAHNKIIKPLPSIKCDSCVLRFKQERQKTKSPNLPLVAVMGTSSGNLSEPGQKQVRSARHELGVRNVFCLFSGVCSPERYRELFRVFWWPEGMCSRKWCRAEIIQPWNLQVNGYL